MNGPKIWETQSANRTFPKPHHLPVGESLSSLEPPFRFSQVRDPYPTSRNETDPSLQCTGSAAPDTDTTPPHSLSLLRNQYRFTPRELCNPYSPQFCTVVLPSFFPNSHTRRRPGGTHTPTPDTRLPATYDYTQYMVTHNVHIKRME